MYTVFRVHIDFPFSITHFCSIWEDVDAEYLEVAYNGYLTLVKAQYKQAMLLEEWFNRKHLKNGSIANKQRAEYHNQKQQQLKTTFPEEFL